jgi:hypothetical protein
LTTWMQAHPELTGAALIGLGFFLHKLSAPFLKQLWARLWGKEKKHRFVTHEELNECVGTLQLTLDEIKAELCQGSMCFREIGGHVRTLADIAHHLCLTVQGLTEMDLGCDDLKKIIREGSYERKGLAKRG